MFNVVVGIDTNSFGFHAVASKKIPALDDIAGQRSTVEWVECSPKQDADDRRILTTQSAYLWFQRLPPGTGVFVEEPLALKNGKTTRLLAIMAGALHAAFILAKPDATWFWVDVATWRKRTLSYQMQQEKLAGRKGAWTSREFKQLARDAVVPFLEQLTPDLVPVYDAHLDLYDAHCIMRYGREVTGADVH